MATMREVAKAAGVSIATASRVLSETGYPVRQDTRDKVVAAAEQLGYRRNALAGSLRRGSSTAVGVCSTELSSLTAMSAVEGISETLGRFGRQAQISLNRWNPTRERAGLELFLEERVSGVLSFPTQRERDAYLRLQAAGIPTVLLNRTIAGLPAPVVRHDFAGGFRLAVDALAGAGHRRIAALLPSEDGDEVLTEQSIGWCAALERVGLEPRPDLQIPARDGLDEPRLRQDLEALFTGGEPPTALFCGRAPATVVALQILDDLGLRVPADVTLVGTADEQWRPLVPSRVPVLLLDSYKLGSTAVELLDELIMNRRATDDREVIVGVELDRVARYQDSGETR